MVTLARQAEIGVWGAYGVSERKIQFVCANSCNSVHFMRKIVRNAVHNAFLNTLTIGTPFPCVPAALNNENEMTPATSTRLSGLYPHTLAYLRFKKVGVVIPSLPFPSFPSFSLEVFTLISSYGDAGRAVIPRWGMSGNRIRQQRVHIVHCLKL